MVHKHRTIRAEYSAGLDWGRTRDVGAFPLLQAKEQIGLLPLLKTHQ